MTFDLGIFLGLLAVAATVYFGLWGFRKDTGDKLSDIRDKIMITGNTIDKAWDLLKMRLGAEAGTVERTLSNLGKTKISAQPGPDLTVYIVDVEKPVLHDYLIIKLSKTTGLEDKEKQLFDDRVPTVSTPAPTRLIARVPCTEPTKCTEYLSTLLKWLDSTYYDSLAEIKKYEDPIQI